MARKITVDVPLDLTAPYAVPEGTTPEQLVEINQAAGEQAAALLADDAKGGTPAERAAQANWLMGAMDVIDARTAEIEAEAAAEAQAMNEVRDRLAKRNAPKDDAEVEADTTDAQPVDDAAADEARRVQAESDASAAADANNNAPALVAAGRRTAFSVAAGAQVPIVRPRPRGDGKASLVASINADGVTAGEHIDWAGIGVAAEKQFRNLPKIPGQSNQINPIGSINIPTLDSALVASGSKGGSDLAEADEAIEWAVSMDRLKKETGRVNEFGEGSLVAAGGWCAPSETLYDLLDFTTDEGMISLPGITITRGGLRYSKGPDFSAVYGAGANFTRTEAQAIAGTPAKPVVNIPCPSFTDNRMVVDGMFFTGDILSAKGYPEAYADFLSKAAKSFAHYVNASVIADAVALATAVNFTAGNQTNSATTELLGAIELTIVDMKYRNRMSLTQAVEIVLPIWAASVLRSDIAKRNGITNNLSVSNADIESYIALRGGAVQWVYDWQDFFATAAGLGAASAAVSFPTSVQFLAYPQGGIVSALSPVIELQAIYDSTLLRTNQYVALFMEQARLTLSKAWDIRVATVTLVNSGVTGGMLTPTGLTLAAAGAAV